MIIPIKARITKTEEKQPARSSDLLIDITPFCLVSLLWDFARNRSILAIDNRTSIAFYAFLLSWYSLTFIKPSKTKPKSTITKTKHSIRFLGIYLTTISLMISRAMITSIPTKHQLFWTRITPPLLLLEFSIEIIVFQKIILHIPNVPYSAFLFPVLV